MLSERVLIALGLSVSLVGILALCLILWLSELPVAQLTVVAAAKDGEMVRVTGLVERVRHIKNDSITLLTVSEKVTRNAIVFDAVNVSEGMTLDMEGEIQLYDGEPELVVRRLETR